METNRLGLEWNKKEKETKEDAGNHLRSERIRADIEKARRHRIEK